jgi:hypothetical protein
VSDPSISVDDIDTIRQARLTASRVGDGGAERLDVRLWQPKTQRDVHAESLIDHLRLVHGQ